MVIWHKNSYIIGRILKKFFKSILIVSMCPRPALYVVGGGAGSCFPKV